MVRRRSSISTALAFELPFEPARSTRTRFDQIRPHLFPCPSIRSTSEWAARQNGLRRYLLPSTTARLSSRRDGAWCGVRVGDAVARAQARGAARQPSRDRASEREPDGDEGVGEVSLRPRRRSRRRHLAVCPRGKNAAHAPKPGTRSSIGRRRRDGASRCRSDLRSGPGRAPP